MEPKELTEREKYLKSLVATLPDTPGVYQYFDNEGTIIYVGKAKNLKRRVSSYFAKNHDDAKTRMLVRRIVDIKFVVVDTEVDALLLENNLIKKYQPRYNVLLKDDKSYPWICVKKEPFPRVFVTRNVINDGSTYYGPYTSLKMVYTIIDLFKQLFQLRNCDLNLNKLNIENQKFKVCLEYHIKNCKAPCIGEQSEEEYRTSILNIHKILKGNTSNVIKRLKEEMIKLADDLKFEQAQIFKEKIEMLENYQSKSTIVSPSISNVDVFSIVDDEKFAYVNFLKVVNGSIIQTHTLEIVKRLEESQAEILPVAIIEIRQRFHSNSEEILVPFELDYQLGKVKVTVPQIGDKKHLLELSTRNVTFYRLEKLKQYELLNPQRRTERILATIQKDLRLKELPVHIECFDNSNLQGTYPVSSCVVFRDARAAKKEYRIFNVKSVEGINDFASMEEVIYRRYHRLLGENQSLPQLIIVDGGKGQLSAALQSLEKLNLRGQIAIIGIAKRLEEIYFPNDSVPLYLDKNSESLKVIQQMRDEAHRFGITHHRKKKVKGLIKSELESIKGVGEKTIQTLLVQFKSVQSIKNQSVEQLAIYIGTAKAQIVYDYFQKSS